MSVKFLMTTCVSLKMSHKPNSRLRICIIGNQAFSLLNFRGPLIADMVAKGHEVLALAPDYDEATRAAVRALGAEPVDYLSFSHRHESGEGRCRYATLGSSLAPTEA